MARLGTKEIGELLRPYLEVDASQVLLEKVQRYVSLLELWNRKLNLTSVRDPSLMVQRHIGESLLLARLLPAFNTLLDLGSGAGFPGLPISLLYPNAAVTLAEAQARKAVFLREAVWMTGSHAQVWADRVEAMDAERRFDVVTLRAVDQMHDALAAAMDRLRPGGTLAFFVRGDGTTSLPEAQWADVASHDVPLTQGRILIARLATSES